MPTLQFVEAMAFILLCLAALSGLLVWFMLTDSEPDPFEYDERLSVHWPEEDDSDGGEDQR